MLRILTRLSLAILISALWATSAEAQRSSDVQRTLSAAQPCMSMDVQGLGTATVDVVGTWSGTLTIYGEGRSGSRDSLDTATANGISVVTVAGYRTLVVCFTTATSGEPVVGLQAAGTGGGGGDLGEVMVEIEGFSTEAKQDTIITALANLDSGTAVTGTVTANLSATDNAVLDDIADGIAVTVSGVATDAKLDTIITALANLDSGTAVTATNLDVQIGGSDTVAVSNAGLTELAAAINSNLVDVNIVSGAGSGGTALADDADFTAGTTSFTPVGGFYQSTITACTDGDTCAAGLTANRGVHVNLRSAAGVELTPATDATEDSPAPETGPLVQCEFDDASINGIDEDDAGKVRCSANRNIYNTIRDAAGNERGVNVTANNELLVELGAGAASIGTLGANSGVDIGDVTLTAGAADIGNVNLEVGGTVIDTNTGTDGAQTIRVTEATDSPIAVSLAIIDNVVFGAGTEAAALRMTLPTDGTGRVLLADPCAGGGTKQYIPIDIVTATTTELTGALAGASTHYYICSINLVTAAANNVAIVDDNTDGCGSPTAGVFGGFGSAAEGWNFGAGGGIALGSGIGSIGRTTTQNAVLCAITSAATQLSGQIVVVAAP